MMIRYIIFLCFSQVVTDANLYGQGRVDSDPILHNIWRTTLKIDRDSSIQRVERFDRNYLLNGFEIYYYKADSLCKVARLNKAFDGTQLTTYYFAAAQPIYVSVERNNFQLANEKSNIYEAIASFENTPDTLENRQHYIERHSASYYFHDDKVRFAAVVTFSEKGVVENVRHDKHADIKQGRDLFARGKRYNLRRE